MNKIVVTVRPTKDPQVRYGTNGKAVATFDGACDRRFKQEGGPTADFFRFVVFGKQAEFVEKYVKKGTKLLIEGELQNNNYQDKNGNTVYGMQIVVSSMEFCESKKSEGATQQQNTQPAPTGPAPEDGFMSIPDGIEEELPFV